MQQITRRLEFDYGHRLIGHESKCSHLHGHRGMAEITVESAELDAVGRVIDFSKIKELVGGWIDKNWDHNLILNLTDPLFSLEDAVQNQIIGPKKPYLMTSNPTAENMVEDLASVSRRLLQPYGIDVVKIRLYETPNCWAEWVKK